MKKKSIALLLILTLLLGLTACGGDDEPETIGTGPGRMIRRIEIAIQPEDADYARTYVTQENMNQVLTMLRGMQTDSRPEKDPDINGGQSLYTVTATFANGEQNVYYLLGHTYLRLGDDDWCLIDPERSEEFVRFLLAHPTDDTPANETTTPSDPSSPSE